MRLESFPHPLAKIIATRKPVKKKEDGMGSKAAFSAGKLELSEYPQKVKNTRLLC